MVDVKGRPRRSWIVSLIPGEGGLLVRLEDEADPEYWEELRVPETELLRLLARVHAITHGAPPDDQTVNVIDAKKLLTIKNPNFNKHRNGN